MVSDGLRLPRSGAISRRAADASSAQWQQSFMVRFATLLPGTRASGASRSRSRLVPRMIRVPFENSECAVDLFQQHDSRQFVGQRHFPERNCLLCRGSNFGAKSIRAADREDEWQGIATLIVTQKLRELH